jgi:putative molybdopterin biosynthesis protein
MASEEIEEALRLAARQEQFLEVVDRDEAEARFRRHLTLAPLGPEAVALSRALGRVLAEDVVAGVDVPAFDRSSVDGFAVRAADVVGASDERPRLLRLNPEILTPGVEPRGTVEPGTATIVATGGMLPRGADAMVMVEYTDAREERGASRVEVSRPVAPGDSVAAAGSDIARGETVLRAGQVLTSREIGSLAAIGLAEVAVWLKPRVAIFSTGDEMVAPGQPLPRGGVYDSNAAILAAAVEEVGGTSIALGIAPDDDVALSALLTEALAYDVALLSGGTSKGAGDVASRVVGRLRDPGIVVHGVALKPGKPICLAVTGGKPVVILPGFPTSAIFTFHEFVAPVLRAFAGLPPERRETLPAVLATRIASQRGRTEYVMVSLVESPGGGLAAYPTGKGSGADGVRAGRRVPLGEGTGRIAGRWHPHRRHADRRASPARGPGGDGEPLHRPRRAHQAARARGALREGNQRREHGGPRGGEARRVRRRRRPPHGSGERRVQSAIPHGGTRARAGLQAHARDRVPARRRALRGQTRR